ncbi:MAG: phosphoglycerate kinase [Candidatus Thermoplasmatota archaeon]|nr:phosphoglycerate kinase [Candidatus Thermoplasmatota archaeon]
MSVTPDRFFTMDDFNFDGKRVYLRLDINSPIHPLSGDVMGASRFISHLDTIRELHNSKLVIVGHQSRPGKSDFTSMRKHAEQLEKLLGKPVQFVDSLFGSEVRNRIRKMNDGDIMMLENSRFYSEEVVVEADDIDIAESTHIVRNLGPLFDYFIIDAFPAIHRAQTSLVGFRRIKPNIAGRLVQKEVAMIDQFTHGNVHPKLAILAGAKIEDSVKVSTSFLKNGIVDTIMVGGVVANAFLWAKGVNIGKKNKDFIIKNNKNHAEIIETCKMILNKFSDRIVLPVDFIQNPKGRSIGVNEKIPDDQILADIGLETISKFIKVINESKAIFLNGPMGVYEIEEYSVGTREILEAVAGSKALTIAGGGHTLNALEKLGIIDRISHASTGGGALISYLSGDPMPVLESLSESRKIFGG